MGERFSKATVTAKIQARVDSIQREYHFKYQHGYAQVPKGWDESQRAYGEFVALCDLAVDLDLPIFPNGSGS